MRILERMPPEEIAKGLNKVFELADKVAEAWDDRPAWLGGPGGGDGAAAEGGEV